jgi:hypothetical protein
VVDVDTRRRAASGQIDTSTEDFSVAAAIMV